MDFYLNNESFKDSNIKEDILETFERLKELKDYILEHKDCIKKNDKIYEIPIISEMPLYEWLFSSNKSDNYQYRDLKKRFMRLLDEASTCCDQEYENICNKTIIELINDKNAFLCFNSIDKKNEAHIANMNTLIKWYRYDFKNNADYSNFNKLASKAFPNIVFNDNVMKSITTLSAPLDIYRNEITVHLEDINDKFISIYKDNHTKGLVSVLRIFESESRFKCTLDGQRETTKNRLTFEFISKNGEKINVLCEPHTKLDRTGNKGDSQYRFDRIYFSAGDSRIADDKVLIAHIGEHL